MEIAVFRHPLTLESGEEQVLAVFDGLTKEQFEFLTDVIEDTVRYDWR